MSKLIKSELFRIKNSGAFLSSIIIIFIITIMILIGCTIYLYPIMKELLKPEGRENLKIEIIIRIRGSTNISTNITR